MLSVILSTSNQQAYVYRDGIEIGRSAVSTDALGKGFGSYVYSALDKFDSTGRREWMSTASFGSARALDVRQLSEHVTIPAEFLENARGTVSPGTTLIVTDVAVSDQTQSKPGPNVLTTN